MQVSETFFSGSGSTGRDASDEYSVYIRGNPKPASEGGDDADNPAAIILFGIARFPLLSQTGNIFSDFSRERLGPGYWKITAHYKPPELNKQTNDASFSFQIGGGTQHINHSIKTRGYGYGLQPIPNHHGAINVGADGSVGGVDIKIPVYSFKTTFYVDPYNMTSAYLEELKQSVAKVNSDEMSMTIDGVYQTFQAGEILLSMVDGEKRIGFGDWSLSFGWEFSPNLTHVIIGAVEGNMNSGIVIERKDGWEYLWVDYQAHLPGDTTDGDDSESSSAASFIELKPRAAYVEQVYYTAPLSGLVPVIKSGLDNPQPWTKPKILATAVIG